MTDLSRIPAALLARAAADPANAHALPALQRALKATGAATPAPCPEVRQSANTGAGEIHITLPLPPKELSPNACVHWAKKQRITREARQRACVLAKEAINRSLQGHAPWWERAMVKIIFHWPDNRRHDADNALASLKSAVDGIADAGVVANDSGLSFLPVETRVDRERPRVEMIVTRTP